MSRAHEPVMAWLLCYDIHKPRHRRRVAAKLEGHGSRVQRSVFIAECSPHQVARLERQCRARMDAQDKFRVYHLLQRQPAALPALRARTQVLPDYWLC